MTNVMLQIFFVMWVWFEPSSQTILSSKHNQARYLTGLWSRNTMCNIFHTENIYVKNGHVAFSASVEVNLVPAIRLIRLFSPRPNMTLQVSNQP